LWIDAELMSPQFRKEGIYKLALKNLTIQSVSSSSEGRNPFVQYAVFCGYCTTAYATLDKNKRELLTSFSYKVMATTGSCKFDASCKYNHLGRKPELLTLCH
ncbi:hypothetical protein PIB30_061174, partial [Stylosanthes scabra]|nr:hypothetical protein [Stylosanthes scabra]